ncbi:MAG: hypothetical protein A3B99_04530 [Candidatus Yanofskybacteria bacterium RIFCSPHIGHO2_02_FULL_44_12b]|uniref:Nudix hydrolase domain-containing protein n=2 Tax=Candidatus Yanofskyibacteriota TaxID=1752733 RepID=A0A1F8GJZ5_9BACT|nr:MAG: hypothetical protein UW79_C0013G0047 [Candidatus Yanofskybacteria bacterium GW2011_GWA2_44_9]OGN04336.1 MAG: hypothetical protein A2659_03335 [Candidatus Yanofskybacteria bacterium RIFCSPHIGHO2_01_FULL_44_24]OGN14443.1 MAG: hypothetical protein A3B99_04530 [Candidatus Yanofskybacteria bacterium RIFCSPHIGHO2_02_FULL_44_12b]OGN25724.1 MAG: hypothetical protein A2925_00870 [Candidatus Yanofskybacteria bacterium RIFCSPLOWO2_01_FULL_44_22]
MEVVYTYEEPPLSYSKSIFLVGPTPRDGKTQSWRPEALRILDRFGYDGVVFVPENRDGSKTENFYEKRCRWEQGMLDRADVIVCWVPRELRTMPAFTTNIEFGLYAHSGRVVLGAPNLGDQSKQPPKMDYLNFVAGKLAILRANTLQKTLETALVMLGSGSERNGGECEIPLNIWRMRAFQNWYQAQKKSGNRLDGAKIEWLSTVRNKPTVIFACAIRPKIFIASENRTKLNDPIVLRLDISTVLMYYPTPNILDTKVVVTKEFRSASSTSDGFIYELPGGSSPFLTDPLEVAVEEVREEVGLDIQARDLIILGSRQLAGTLSGHKAHLFGYRLTQSQLNWLESQKGIVHGADLDNPTGERAYTEIWTVADILKNNLLDWSNVGMILSLLR